MQAAKRCVRCNTINDPSQIYCINCGKYLAMRSNEDARTTIWDMDPNVQDRIVHANRITQNNNTNAKQKYIVICPQCGKPSDVVNGAIPLSCNQCGYFYQAGIDKPVLQSSQSNIGPGADVSKPVDKMTSSPADPPKKNSQDSSSCIGPLARATKDTSSMRLIIISQNGAVPENVDEKGGIVGENGTILKRIRTKQQISIWHSPTGWYARTLTGTPLYNGVPMNTGMQIKLSDGDMISVEREHIRVEII